MIQSRFRCALIGAAAASLLFAAPRARGQTTPAVPASASAARALSLDEALRLAESASPDVRIAKAGVQRAQGSEYQARSGYLPQIAATAGYTRTLRSQFQALAGSAPVDSGPPPLPALCSPLIPPGATPAERQAALDQSITCEGSSGGGIDFSRVGFGAANQYNLGLSLSQNLFAGGRVMAQNRAAAASRQGAEIGLVSTRAQTLLQVAQAYFDAALSDRLVQIAEATLAQADTTLSQTQLARRVGTQPEFDVLRAQVARSNQIPVVIQQRANRDIAYMQLLQLLDLPLDQPVTLTTSLGDTASLALPASLASLGTSVPDTNTGRRAPVRQAEANVTAQQAQVTIARAEQLPSLSLTSQYGRVAFPQNGVPSWSDFLSNWTVGVGVQLPLFTGGRIRGDKLIAEAGLVEARARLEQTRELAALDARRALSQLQAAEASWQASAGTAEQATQAYQIAQVRFREGISTQTELTDSRLQLQQSEANRAGAARDLQVARLRVMLLPNLPIGAGGISNTMNASAPGGLPGAGQPQTTTPQQRPPSQSAAGGQLASQTGNPTP